MELDRITNIIRNSLNQLYRNDYFLFERNNGKGICERGIGFRFSHYLQLEINRYNEDLFVDCDFNSSMASDGIEYEGKSIPNEDGTSTRRFIDIIVHDRNQNCEFCIELKKWNNSTKEGISKDYNNLRKLTTMFSYDYGFSIILGNNREHTRVRQFSRFEELDIERL